MQKRPVYNYVISSCLFFRTSPGYPKLILITLVKTTDKHHKSKLFTVSALQLKYLLNYAFWTCFYKFVYSIHYSNIRLNSSTSLRIFCRISFFSFLQDCTSSAICQTLLPATQIYLLLFKDDEVFEIFHCKRKAVLCTRQSNVLFWLSSTYVMGSPYPSKYNSPLPMFVSMSYQSPTMFRFAGIAIFGISFQPMSFCSIVFKTIPTAVVCFHPSPLDIFPLIITIENARKGKNKC